MQHEAESNSAPQACCSSMVTPTGPDHAVVPTTAGRAANATTVSNYVRPADVVLNLGSENGSLCETLAQRVGPQGHVISLECHADALTIARQNHAATAEQPDHAKIEFRRGRVHDLQLDLEQLETRLRAHPARSSDDWLQTQALTEQLRQSNPLIAADSIDLVLGEQVLNLVEHA